MRKIKLKPDIGILTLPVHANFGGALQALALYEYLRRCGFKPILIRREATRSPYKAVVKNLVAKIPFVDFRNWKQQVKKKNLHKSFIGSYVQQSKRLENEKDVKNLVEKSEFRAVIVGSDQVWRLEYMPDRDYRSFFLSFIDSRGLKKISYAASFGSVSWAHPELSPSVRKYLQDFDAISVRELSGRAICGQLGRHDAQVVLDPTLLLERKFYDRLIGDAAQNLRFDVFTYILDNSEKISAVLQRVRANSSFRSQRVVSLNEPSGLIEIPEWLGCFKAANFIVTDSFHGVIFSIIFEKQFLGVVNKKRGSDRMKSLLGEIGLADRLIDDSECYDFEKLVNSKIDYCDVNRKLHRWRSFSERFIANAISHP